MIDDVFRRLNAGGLATSQRRRPGVSRDLVESALGNYGLHAPEDLILIYGHCDGTQIAETDQLGTIDFYPGFYWLSVEEAIETYVALSPSQEWNRAWLPILANGGGDFYAVICDVKSPNFGEVVGFVIGEADQIAEFESLSAMIEVIDCSFKEGAFFIVQGRLKADFTKMRAIAHQIQPEFLEHEV